MKIGIFGGSFNPIHYGHIFLAKNIIQNKLVDELWFMVSPQNPLKVPSDLASDIQRLENVRHAISEIEGVRVSDFEFHQPRPSFMCDTLFKLQSLRKNDIFFLVIGADNWKCFDKWKNYEKILERFHIIIYPRKGYDVERKNLPSSVSYLDLPLYDISSTQLRQMLKERKDISSYIP